MTDNFKPQANKLRNRASEQIADEDAVHFERVALQIMDATLLPKGRK